MRSFVLLSCLVALLLSWGQPVEAQSASMPLPQLVLKDADGKIMAQIAGLGGSPEYMPQIILDIDGKLAVFEIKLDDGWILQHGVHFSNPGCVGDVYMYPPGTQKWWDVLADTRFGVVGPDPGDGTYRVFRTTSTSSSPQFPLSVWDNGTCQSLGGGQLNLAPAEEVLPNPFAGFHGPTTTNPERLLTISGGDKLP